MTPELPDNADPIPPEQPARSANKRANLLVQVAAGCLATPLLILAVGFSLVGLAIRKLFETVIRLFKR